jgi:SulP family sulfate permease
VPPGRADRLGPGDIVAGLSVALVVIPQSLAYANLAGLPPALGLYAAILPPVAAALFASSPYLQTGPVAMTSILVLGALVPLAAPQTTEYIGLAALLAITVGVARLLIGILRAGFVAYLMSQPVLTGFTTAAALLIVASQLPTALGTEDPGRGLMMSALLAAIRPAEWSVSAVGLSLVTGFIIVGGRRLHALFPGVLIAVGLGIAYGLSGWNAVETVGTIPGKLPSISVDLPWREWHALLIPGLVIAVVGFAEPAAIARAMAAQSRQPWSADREFVSQGVANLAAGFSGAFPVGGSFSRTMVALKAGARTRWTGAITGLAVFAFLPVADILAPLPKAVLAAVVIAAVLGLIEFKALLRITRQSRAQAAVAWLTFVMTLALAPRIDIAVVLGIGASVVVHLWRERRIEVIRQYQDETLTLEPIGVLYFGSASDLNDALIAALAANPAAQHLVLDLRKVGRIDYTGALVIQQIAKQAEAAGLGVKIIPGQRPQGAKLLERVLAEDSRWIEDQ